MDRKKPPININETRKPDTEAKPGPLDYVGKASKGGPDINWTQVLISSALALFLAVLVMFQFMPSKKDVITLNENVNEVADRTAAVDSKLTGEANRINTVVNTMGEYAKKSELAGFAPKAELNTLISELVALKNELGTVSSKLNSDLSDKISNLEARIQELEGQFSDQEEGSVKGLSASIETQFFDYVALLVADVGKEVSIPLRLRLVNNSGRDLEDIQLTIGFNPEGPMSGTFSDGYPRLWGGGTSWQTPYGYSGYGMVFTNGWGLDIEKGDTETHTLTLTMKVDIALSSNMRWTPEVYIEEFD